MLAQCTKAYIVFQETLVVVGGVVQVQARFKPCPWTLMCPWARHNSHSASLHPLCKKDICDSLQRIPY